MSPSALETVRVNANSLDSMYRTAVRQANRDLREVCGLLVDVGSWIELMQTRNLRRRMLGFIISPKDARAIERDSTKLGRRVVGTFHSHILSKPIPSAGDIAGAYEGHLMLIFDTLEARRRKVAMWRIRRGKAARVRVVRAGPNKPLEPTPKDGAAQRLRSACNR